MSLTDPMVLALSTVSSAHPVLSPVHTHCLVLSSSPEAFILSTGQQPFMITGNPSAFPQSFDSSASLEDHFTSSFFSNLQHPLPHHLRLLTLLPISPRKQAIRRHLHRFHHIYQHLYPFALLSFQLLGSNFRFHHLCQHTDIVASFSWIHAPLTPSTGSFLSNLLMTHSVFLKKSSLTLHLPSAVAPVSSYHNSKRVAPSSSPPPPLS